MNEIKRAKYNDLLIRATGQDVGPPAPFLGGEVVPTFPVDELTMDLRWLQGQRTYRARTSITGAAAGVPAMRLLNPPNSGILVIVEQFSMLFPVANQGLWVIATQLASLATPVMTIGGLDSRVGGGPLGTNRGAAQVSSEINQALAFYPSTNVWSEPLQAGVSKVFTEELVLSPGFALDMLNAVVATVAWFNIRWRERSVDALELNA